LWDCKVEANVARQGQGDDDDRDDGKAGGGGQQTTTLLHEVIRLAAMQELPEGAAAVGVPLQHWPEAVSRLQEAAEQPTLATIREWTAALRVLALCNPVAVTVTAHRE
jgi:hypothetical protein